MQKLIKTSDELIEHMKNKGIKFNIINEIEAKFFLENNNYYFKLAAYRNNYLKKSNGEYINLEFAYLRELSIIDMELRHLVLEMALDIEHSLKVILLNDIANNFKNNSYDIVSSFLTDNQKISQDIERHSTSNYCGDLINKYSPNFPIWVLLEIISFGDLVKFYNFYSKNYKKLKDRKLLYSIRQIRNAAAHNNCLIYNLKSTNSKTKLSINTKVNKYVSSFKKIKKDTRKKKLRIKFFEDFITLLYAYKIFVNSENLIEKTRKKLKALDRRMLKNKNYFLKNEIISSAYNFNKIIIDAF